jgi:thiosulfate reductase cytochrome b subunit
MGITGTMYLYEEYWSYLNLPLFVLDNVAVFHTAGAFMLIAFFIVHVYMTTTGHTIFSNIKAMITGSEEIHEVTETAKTSEEAQSISGD